MLFDIFIISHVVSHESWLVITYMYSVSTIGQFLTLEPDPRGARPTTYPDQKTDILQCSPGAKCMARLRTLVKESMSCPYHIWAPREMEGPEGSLPSPQRPTNLLP